MYVFTLYTYYSLLVKLCYIYILYTLMVLFVRLLRYAYIVYKFI